MLNIINWKLSYMSPFTIYQRYGIKLKMNILVNAIKNFVTIFSNVKTDSSIYYVIDIFYI